MRAIVQTKYGDSGALHLDRVAVPEIADGQVLVRTHAAGLDRGTWHMMTGKPYLMRIAGMGFKGPKDRVPGRDLAGIVESVGSAVTRFAVGDEVYGIGRGAFAELAVASEAKLAHKPASLSFEQAAVVPISAGTALQALTDQGRLGAGQSVLVIGASGGVGGYVVQLAKRRSTASRRSTCSSTTSVATGTPVRSPPTGSSAPSPSTTSPRSC
nr:NADP-dependent oxidoreductase [Nocardioides panzhihuensis]